MNINRKKIIVENIENDIQLGVCQNINGLSGNDLVLIDGERFYRVKLEKCYPQGELKKIVDNNDFTYFDDCSIFRGANLSICIDGKNIKRYALQIYYFESAKSNNDSYDISLLVDMTCAKSENEISLWNLIINNKVERGFWTSFDIHDKYALLDVNCARFFYEPEKVLTKKDIFYINGKNIVDIPSLYLELGEAIRGPLGYMGKNYQSLIDCLSGVNVDNDMFKIIWKDHEYSCNYLDDYAFFNDSMNLINHSLKCFDYEELFDNIIDDPNFLFECKETPFDVVCSILGKSLILD